MTKVLVVVPFPMSEENRLARAAQLETVQLGPGIEFHFRPVRAAPANYTSEHDSVLADVSILDACKSAQAEGYDAVCIDTMSDSGLAAARSVLDIPVIGPGRASMLVALMLGERFSILIMWDRWRHLYRKTIAELGLGARCASVRSIGVTPDNQALLAGKEDRVFPLLLAAARACIERGRRRGDPPRLDDDAPGARLPRRAPAGPGDQPRPAHLQARGSGARARPAAQPPGVPAAVAPRIDMIDAMLGAAQATGKGI